MLYGLNALLVLEGKLDGKKWRGWPRRMMLYSDCRRNDEVTRLAEDRDTWSKTNLLTRKMANVSNPDTQTANIILSLTNTIYANYTDVRAARTTEYLKQILLHTAESSWNITFPIYVACIAVNKCTWVDLPLLTALKDVNKHKKKCKRNTDAASWSGRHMDGHDTRE